MSPKPLDLDVIVRLRVAAQVSHIARLEPNAGFFYAVKKNVGVYLFLGTFCLSLVAIYSDFIKFFFRSVFKITVAQKKRNYVA